LKNGVAATTVAVLAAWTAQAASAHVTVNPSEAEAASFARFAIRVPTERPVATNANLALGFGIAGLLAGLAALALALLRHPRRGGS
jgi:uncharacterized protein YcnI